MKDNWVALVIGWVFLPPFPSAFISYVLKKLIFGGFDKVYVGISFGKGVIVMKGCFNIWSGVNLSLGLITNMALIKSFASSDINTFEGNSYLSAVIFL